MKRNVMIVYLNTREETSVKVQKILSVWGCLIKTRLGIHDDVLDNCTQIGLLFLDLACDIEKLKELEYKLNLVSGVDARLITMEI